MTFSTIINHPIKLLLIVFTFYFSSPAISGKVEVDDAVHHYFNNYENVRYKIKSYGFGKKHCKSGIFIHGKTPIKASKRWILKVNCPGSWNASMSVSTELEIKVARPIVDIHKGSKITANIVKITKEWSSSAKQQLDVIGKIATKNIKKGEKIKPWQVKKHYIVKKKQRIRVISDTGIIKIMINAIALEKGNKSDIIKVENEKTKKKFKAKIIDFETATINI